MNFLLVIIVCIAALFSLLDAWSNSNSVRKATAYFFALLFCILGFIIVRGVL